MGVIDWWNRRAWRHDEAAIAALTGSRPAVVITGGSDGIGRALAATIPTPAHTAVLVARTEAKLDQARSELTATGQDNVLVLAQDITDPAAPDSIRAFLAEHDLYADILVNSAGIATTGDFVDEAADKLATLTDLNVTALTRLCRTFLPDMLVRGRGGIINVASLGGFAPGPYQAAYYASKAYVISLSRALRHETRGLGVRIVCLAPGPVNTDFHARAHGESALYRMILPALSADQVARSTRRGYAIGHGIIVPGLFGNLTALAVRVLPGILTTPAIAILLKPRPTAPLPARRPTDR